MRSGTREGTLICLIERAAAHAGDGSGATYGEKEKRMHDSVRAPMPADLTIMEAPVAALACMHAPTASSPPPLLTPRRSPQ